MSNESHMNSALSLAPAVSQVLKDMSPREVYPGLYTLSPGRELVYTIKTKHGCFLPGHCL